MRNDEIRKLTHKIVSELLNTYPFDLSTLLELDDEEKKLIIKELNQIVEYHRKRSL